MFEFIETEVFTKKIQELISAEEYIYLQNALIEKPDKGDLIPGGRGVRKLRWSSGQKGKRGGIRVLYYLYLSEHQIYMLYAFRKSEQNDLSSEELAVLGEYVKRYLKS
jgi:hypothetical protein